MDVRIQYSYPLRSGQVSGVPGSLYVMRAPRIQCPACERPVALMPTRRTGYGVIHDHKRDRRSLVLCEGSMKQVALADAALWQDALPGVGDADGAEPTLF